jgi:hypothetical protein
LSVNKCCNNYCNSCYKQSYFYICRAVAFHDILKNNINAHDFKDKFISEVKLVLSRKMAGNIELCISRVKNSC